MAEGGVTEEVAEEVRHCVAEGGHTLHLSGLRLSNVPALLFSLTSLRTLSLRHNELEELPDSFPATLCNVEMLDLSRNRLKSLPATLSACRRLKSLQVSGNELQTLPASMKELRCLESINLADNRLQELPEFLYVHLPRLLRLSVANNTIQTIPEAAANLAKTLESFTIFGNPLREAPDLIFSMFQLQQLSRSKEQRRVLISRALVIKAKKEEFRAKCRSKARKSPKRKPKAGNQVKKSKETVAK